MACADNSSGVLSGRGGARPIVPPTMPSLARTSSDSAVWLGTGQPRSSGPRKTPVSTRSTATARDGAPVRISGATMSSRCGGLASSTR